MILSGADIVVRTLIEQGSEVVFGYPGGQIINVYDSLYKYQDELRHVLTAHEQGPPMPPMDTPAQQGGLAWSSQRRVQGQPIWSRV